MPLDAFSADYMLDQWGTNKALYASLHTAYSATGTNELTGGSPAYARIAITWASAASSSKSLNGTLPTFNIPASTTVEFIGFWDALTSGNFSGMIPNGGSGGTTPFTFTALASSDVITAPGSGYANGQTVVIFPTAGSTTPAGVTAGTVYFIISVSGDAFEISTTSGGSAVNITGDGSGIVQQIFPETFASQGTLAVSAGSMALT